MIGITLGDPNGVGPEILLRTFLEKGLPCDCLAIGDYGIIRFCNDHLDLRVPLNRMKTPGDHRKGHLNIMDPGIIQEKDLTIGEISEKGGFAGLRYVEIATEMALTGTIEAIVTLPIHKEAVRMVKPDFRGHTDLIAELCQVKNFTMMLVADMLIVTHISMHVSMREALDRIRTGHILEVIRLTHQAVGQLRSQARLAVAGLNPHAGEHGAFGDEEILEIGPAVVQARAEGMDVHGPLPPDTLFYQAVQGKYDAVVCMYHDQGHIPLKLLAFDDAVNVTLGLPVVRTSVDHGTAFDIAYQGKASLQSFYNAMVLAGKLSQAKEQSGVN
ncbi:MAG: 4-hydroxythreonine-4-phosphate dehydrogenase PdxA [Cyclobacteriaceae bacterium]|nr:4-hydroxythreonine-4-phosphate dehydrogenase PdxA [Cyclobacteriaceae bacterium]